MKDYRMIVKGIRRNCEDFTIELTWKHSAAGMITSVVDNGEFDGTMNLNLLVEESRVDFIRKLAKECGLKEV